MAMISAMPRPHRQKPPERPCAPEGALVYAIGDVHGRLDLFERLLSRIRRDAARSQAVAAVKPIAVFLGDYIDRGPESRAILERLCNDPLPGFETHCLLGNHEAELLGFLKDAARGPGWARYGGAETLHAYGVTAPRTADPIAWEAARRAFAEALPASHRIFLEKLPLYVTLGDYLFVHAGVRPGRALADQEKRDLIAIREPFLSAPNGLPYVVVHGHTPENRPVFSQDRLGLDTGAYVTGVLTAARLFKDAVHFIQATAPQVQQAPVLQVISAAEITQRF
jgi:serine/threonine protein phosphatase 1